MTRSQRRDMAGGLVSLVTLVALFIVPPLFLVTQVGWPLPTTIPSWDDVQQTLTIGIQDEIVVKAVALLAWIAWAEVAAAIVLEVVAAIHGRAAQARLVLPGVRAAVGQLVASATFAVTSFGPLQAGASLAVVPPVAQVVDIPDRVSVLAEPPPDPAATATAFVSKAPQASRTATAEHHDSYWAIAERALGDGLRWREIRDLNVGRTMLDGATITTDSQDVTHGWQLLLPADTAPPAEPPAPPPAEPSPPSAGIAEPAEVTVARGDNMWSIAERHLGASLHRQVSDAEVAPYWLRFIEANRGRLVHADNPNLVYPGQVFVLPAVETTPTEPPEARPVAVTDERTGPPEASPTSTTDDGQSSDAASTDPEPAADGGQASPTSTSTASDAVQPAPTVEPPTSRPEQPGEAPTDPDTTETRSQTGNLIDAAVRIGSSAALAVLTLAALARRRRSRGRSARPGTTVAPRSVEDIETERRLAATVGDDVLARAWETARILGTVLRAEPGLPSVTGIVVGTTGDVTVHLAEPVPPIEPFVAGPSGTSTWSLSADARGSDETTGESVPVLETLVSLGRTDAGDWVFVDIESLGAVAIEGDPDHALRLLRSLVAELALQPVNHYVDLTVVGLDPPAVVEQGVIMVDRLDDAVVRGVQQAAADTSAALTLNGLESTAAARARGVARDGLVVAVVVAGAETDPVLLSRLVESVMPGGHGAAVVALGSLGSPATQLVVGDDGALQIPHLGLSAQAAGLDSDDARRVDDLLSHEPDTVIELPKHEHNGVAATRTAPAAAAVDQLAPYEEPGWEFCVRVLAGLVVETHDGEVVSFRRGENPAVPNPNTQRGPELLAYLALQPDRTATFDDICTNLWWGKEIGGRSVETMISGTRRVLGRTGLLSHAKGGPSKRLYRLAPGVVTDVELLAGTVAYAQQVANLEPGLAVSALRPHLAHIETEPFRDGGLADWASAYRIVDQVQQTVVEGALLAAELLAGQGPDGLPDALWAVEQGLRASATNEALIRAAMELDAQMGNRDTANRRYIALATKLAVDAYEPEAATTELRTRIMAPSYTIG